MEERPLPRRQLLRDVLAIVATIVLFLLVQRVLLPALGVPS